MLRAINIIEEGKLGGPQIRIVAVAVALRPEVETTVVMPRENAERFCDRCDRKGLGYQLFSMSRITKEWRVALRYVLFFGAEILRLVSYFRGHPAEIVHVSGGSWQFKGVIAGCLAGKTVLWHLNDTSMPGFIRATFRILSPLADGYIFASHRSEDYYGSLVSSEKLRFVIPAPVDVSYFNPYAEPPDEDKVRIGWQGKTVVGLVGNVSRVKGVDIFIRMAAEANSATENLHFVVVGPVFPNQQKYYDSLCRLASELGVTNIEFVGGRDDVRPLLKCFDIYVCSSNAESSPISVWEAMAMEVPIVSTDVGDVPLYVKEGENGYIAPVGDHKALAGFVCKLAADETLRERLGKAARTRVVEELDIKACAEKHLEAYRTVLGEN